jgi:hypothetical protein
VVQDMVLRLRAGTFRTKFFHDEMVHSQPPVGMWDEVLLWQISFACHPLGAQCLEAVILGSLAGPQMHGCVPRPVYPEAASGPIRGPVSTSMYRLHGQGLAPGAQCVQGLAGSLPFLSLVGW